MRKLLHRSPNCSAVRKQGTAYRSHQPPTPRSFSGLLNGHRWRGRSVGLSWRLVPLATRLTNWNPDVWFALWLSLVSSNTNTSERSDEGPVGGCGSFLDRRIWGSGRHSGRHVTIALVSSVFVRRFAMTHPDPHWMRPTQGSNHGDTQPSMDSSGHILSQAVLEKPCSEDALTGAVSGRPGRRLSSFRCARRPRLDGDPGVVWPPLTRPSSNAPSTVHARRRPAAIPHDGDPRHLTFARYS